MKKKMLTGVLAVLGLGICAQTVEFPSEKQYLEHKNLIKNPGFENGTSKWTGGATSTWTVTSTAEHVGSGRIAGAYTATGMGPAYDLEADAVAIPAGLYGKNCMASINYKGGDTGQVLRVTDGSNTLTEVDLEAPTTYQTAEVSFICPSSGNLQLKIVSPDDAPILYIDDVYMGENYRITNISQAKVAGKILWQGGSCGWTGNSATRASYSADGDCTATTYGSASEPATKIPAITFASLAPGYVNVHVSGGQFYNDSDGNDCTWIISDGVTTSGFSRSARIATNLVTSQGIFGSFKYDTAQSNKTFEIQYLRNSAAGNCLLNPDGTDGDMQIVVTHFPLDSQQAYTPDVSSQWGSVYTPVTTNCQWTDNNGSWEGYDADSDCPVATARGNASAPDTKIPAIKIPSLKAGSYLFVAQAVLGVANAASASCAWRFHDGSNAFGYASQLTDSDSSARLPVLVGLKTYDSVQTDLQVEIQYQKINGTTTCAIEANNDGEQLEITVIPLDQTLPTPNLVNSVQSTYAGITRVETALLNCSSASAITSQHGSWVSSIGNISSGKRDVTLTTGIFASTPFCTISNNRASSTPLLLGIEINSATDIDIDCADDSGTACGASYDATITCIGAK